MHSKFNGYTITITLILIFSLIVLGYAMLKDDRLRTKISNNNYKTACETNNGQWLEKYKECEGLAENICERYEGKYKECESPCRHDPEAQVCTNVCVKVCKFD